MELYTLDGLLRRTEIIEGYESFIWTERYSDIGECEIITPSTQQYRNLLASGTFLALSESKRVMKIETIENTQDSDGARKLKVTAKEITNILNDRVAKTSAVGSKPKTWKATGKPSDILRTLFDYTCRDAVEDPTDKLPLLVTGSLYSTGNLSENTTNYTVERDKSPLFEAIKELADVWDLGFRLYKGDDTGKLYFDVYKGNDRTSSQQLLPAVIFSPDLDSLQNVSELTSVAKSKNVARVICEMAELDVYTTTSSNTTAGFDKRVLYVNAMDVKYPDRTYELTSEQQTAIKNGSGLKTALPVHVDALNKLSRKLRLNTTDLSWIQDLISNTASSEWSNTDKGYVNEAISVSTNYNPTEDTWLTATLTQRGNEALAKNRSISAFDGEITQLSPYKYNRDYSMGDLVEMRNSDGLTNQMLVTEQIFTADGTGERAYPTLTIKLFITPGSWLAWENTQVWANATATWATA